MTAAMDFGEVRHYHATGITHRCSFSDFQQTNFAASRSLEKFRRSKTEFFSFSDTQTALTITG